MNPLFKYSFVNKRYHSTTLSLSLSHLPKEMKHKNDLKLVWLNTFIRTREDLETLQKMTIRMHGIEQDRPTQQQLYTSINTECNGLLRQWENLAVERYHEEKIKDFAEEITCGYVTTNSYLYEFHNETNFNLYLQRDAIHAHLSYKRKEVL